MMNDLYLFNTGENFEAYNCLGSQPTAENGRLGWRFTVWAPKAKRVSVVGDWNSWDREAHPMERQGETGCWSLFIPELPLWTIYKYDIQGEDGTWNCKADPFARHFETRPGTASRLYCESKPFKWTDKKFMDKRPAAEAEQALNIYEMHLGSWRLYPDGSPYNYRDIAEQLADYLNDMGYNAVEFMPLTEYPFDDSWGYQVTGYFAPTSRYGTPEDLKYLINHLHKKGIRVILDWVPAHFPRDAAGLARFDGGPLFEHPDSRKGEHKEWGTLVFDFASKEVQSFLLSSANFWIKEFHIDGLRVDAVSSMLYLDYGRKDGEWVPNFYGGHEHLEAIDFLRRLNGYIRFHYPQVIMAAEESTAFPRVTERPEDGGLGFTHKWNMGWMHDTLNYMSVDYYARHYHHNQMTFSMTYAFSERFILALSHDEVVHGKCSLIGKMPGDIWRQCASLRTLLAWQIGHPGAKLNFMGYEFGQFVEWRFKEELEWFMLEHEHHRRLFNYVKTLNHLYLEHGALWQDDHSWNGFEWLQADDKTNSVFAFARRNPQTDEILVFILNLTPAVLESYDLRLPRLGEYELILNSDDEAFGGSNYLGKKQRRFKVTQKFETIKQVIPPEELPADAKGRRPSKAKTVSEKRELPPLANLKLPPLSAMVYRWKGDQN